MEKSTKWGIGAVILIIVTIIGKCMPDDKASSSSSSSTTTVSSSNKSSSASNKYVGRWSFSSAQDLSGKRVSSSNLKTIPSYLELSSDGSGVIYFEGMNDIYFSWQMEGNEPVFSGAKIVVNKEGKIVLQTGGILWSLKPTMLYYFFNKG